MYFYLTDLCPAEVSRLGIETSEAGESHQYSWDIRELQTRMLSQVNSGDCVQKRPGTIAPRVGC